MSIPPAPAPVELRFNAAERALVLTFEDGFTAALPFELLRVESPSAEVQGHGGSARPAPPAGKQNIGVTGAEPVGRYAVRIVFSDGHDSGIFSWAYLRELASDADERMAAYLARLSGAGLKRA